MQIIDGKLYPPMAAKVKSEGGSRQLEYTGRYTARPFRHEKKIPPRRTLKETP